MTRVIPPVININGTAPETLTADIRSAVDALYKASWAVGQTAPHPRDWQTVDDGGAAYRTAQAAHDRRLVALSIVREELEAIHADIEKQVEEREAHRATYGRGA